MFRIEFSGPGIFELLPNGSSAKMMSDLSLIQNGKVVLTVPKGFVTDFASVPRPLWSIFPPMGKYSLAAIFHDYLYACGLLSRKGADKLFLVLMKHLGVPYWKRQSMYWGVRLGGWVAWNGHRKTK